MKTTQRSIKSVKLDSKSVFLSTMRRSMIESKVPYNFTSYIGLDSATLRNGGDVNGTDVELKPKLLSGEQVIGFAHNVVCYTPLTEREQGKVGSLFVTNYKLTFVLHESDRTEQRQRNFLLGIHDVALSNVGAVWLTDSITPERRRRLLPDRDIPSKVKGLQIICKNMKVLSFNFVKSEQDAGRTVARSLMHYAFPKVHYRLFAYDCREAQYASLPPDMNMYRRPADWKRELERCNCPHWRITCINGTSDAFMTGASETLIVPNSVLDCNLMDTSRHFRGGRLGVWTWGRPEGAALLRSSELNTEHAANFEGVYLEHVRKLHPKLTVPQVFYLCGNPLNVNKSSQAVLPTLKELQTSYRKVADLCSPATLSHFWEQDSSYYTVLDNSRWMRYVATALNFAHEAAGALHNNTTVVLQEGDGVDYCAVVASLTQLLLDPSTRSLAGFQSLIQKEWIAMGHPFCDRLGHITPQYTKDKETSEIQLTTSAPVFLLFLDCCYQLQRQFPSAFQFSCIYLISLWDASLNQLFDTFLFNNNRDRDLAVAEGLVLRPVWDWSQQYTDEYVSLFYNPLYEPIAPTKTVVIDRLNPCTNIAGMEFWSECYERWLPPLDLPASGDIQYYMRNVQLLREIHDLKEKVQSLSSESEQTPVPVRREHTSATKVSRFFPFSMSRGVSRAAFMNGRSIDALRVSLIDATKLLDQLELINAPD